MKQIRYNQDDKETQTVPSTLKEEEGNRMQSNTSNDTLDNLNNQTLNSVVEDLKG